MARNVEVYPENLRAMLEYPYIEPGLLQGFLNGTYERGGEWGGITLWWTNILRKVNLFNVTWPV